MLKKNTLGNASSKSLAEAFKCQECLHFKQLPLAAQKEPCEKLGVRGVNVAPKCFTPDITRVAKNADQFVAMVSFFQDLTYAERRTFLGVLRQKPKRIALGTKLYFKVGKDYISNYLCGYVAGYSSDGRLMLMGNPDKVRGQAFLAFMDKEAEDLMTWQQWKVKRQALRDANKIFDPSNQVIKRTSVKDEYEPPSIDRAPKEWYEKLSGKDRGTAKKKSFKDVVDQMSFNVA